MDTESKLKEVADKLLVHTEEGAIEWKKSLSLPKSYSVSYKDYSFRISESESTYDDVRDQLLPYEYYLFELLDEGGTMVESIEDHHADVGRSTLKELYLAARRKAHNVEHILDKVLKDLT